MTYESLVDELLHAEAPAERRRWLRAHAAQFDDHLVETLKARADHFMRVNAHRTAEIGRLILDVAELTGNPLHRALGLRALGNAHLMLGQYAQALESYDAADRIYVERDRPVERARNQVGRVNALMHLSRAEAAFAAAEWARPVLIEHGRTYSLAMLLMNVAIIHDRAGDDRQALALWDEARHYLAQLGPAGEAARALVDSNRSIVLRELGQYQAAVQACLDAYPPLERLGHKSAIAKVDLSLATTYYFMGRYNEALRLFDRARTALLEEGMTRDAVLADLFVTDCYLQLNRFQDVLDRCGQVRRVFSSLGVHYEVAQAVFNEGIAHARLYQFDAAEASFAEARRLFAGEGIDVWQAAVDIELALLAELRGDPAQALAQADAARQILVGRTLPAWRCQAELTAARALAALGRDAEATERCQAALALAEDKDLPWLAYQCHHLLGRLAEHQGHLEAGHTHYADALASIERLRGHLALELRSSFLADKDEVYQDAVAVSLALGQPEAALEVVERGKSRALIDLLAEIGDLRIRVRDQADQALVAELDQLRAEHRWFYRRLAQREEAEPDVERWLATRQEMEERERCIAWLLERLQIRSADYAEDAVLWQVQTYPVRPFLSPDTTLVEYTPIRGQLAAFVIDVQGVQPFLNLVPSQRLATWLSLLWLNLNAVPARSGPADSSGLDPSGPALNPALSAVEGGVKGRSASADASAEALEQLEHNVQGLLRRLYSALIEPLVERFGRSRKLMIVPHGPLHYLPFQALFDGERYLIERYEMTYLPASSVLKFCRERRPPRAGQTLVMAHSSGGRLPFTLREAETVAATLGTEPFVEDEATLERLRARAGYCSLVHLAAHGEFRPDNPLFSGLALADAPLNTLDVFNLHLPASLVTLSACQTGSSVVGGGDELIGLARGFLYAGAASLLLSLWRVEDRSTALLMQTFYTRLKAGETKAAALQAAQRAVLSYVETHDGRPVQPYAHPFFWAPFCLIGDDGRL